MEVVVFNRDWKLLPAPFSLRIPRQGLDDHSIEFLESLADGDIPVEGEQVSVYHPNNEPLFSDSSSAWIRCNDKVISITTQVRRPL